MRSALDLDRPAALGPRPAEPLLEMWHLGRSAWPHLDLGHEDFATWLRARLAPDQDLAALCAADLFLVCACLLDVTGARAAFHRRFARDVDRHLRRVVVSAEPRATLEAELVSQLLTARPPGDVPHLSHYSGRGPLTLWLRLVALRCALSAASGARALTTPRCGRGHEAMLVTRPSLRPTRFARAYRSMT